MRNNYIFFFIIFFSISGFLNAQYGSRVTVKGSIIDSKTKRPVEFANIGFVGAGVGTVSNENGDFSLEFIPKKIEEEETLQISVIGYEPRYFSKSDVLRAVDEGLKLSLDPISFNLREVVLSSEKKIKSTIGHLHKDDYTVGYWKSKASLGGEITTRVRVRRKNTTLNNLKINVLGNQSDSILVRVNVYDYDNHYVGRNLLTKSITHTITRKSGLEVIPLEEYNIVVDEDIVVGVELLKFYGKGLGFAVAGIKSRGTSFLRYNSQSAFRPIPGTKMAFQLDISNVTRRDNGPERRYNPEFITLYWDTSALHEDRNIEKELATVKALLSASRQAEVELITFSNNYERHSIINLNKETIKTLINYLATIDYCGAAMFNKLPRPSPRYKGAAILVTQGQTIFSELTPNFEVPLFVMTSYPKASKNILENAAYLSDGDYLDGSIEDIDDLVRRYTHFIEEKAIEEIPSAIATGTISYIVGKKEIPLQGASVSLQDSYRSVLTGINGNYRIPANPDNILEVTFPGMDVQTFKIPEQGGKNIVLTSQYDILDEVVLTNKKEEKELVQTPQGMRNADAVGYKNNIIDEEEITSKYTTLGQVLRRDAGVEVRYDPFTRREVYIFPRTFYNSILTPQPPIIVIDGVIYNQTDDTQLPELDMQNIKSINPNSSLIATTRYGSIAAGGVIEIKTKTGNRSSKKKKEKPSALAKGNTYTGAVTSLSSLGKTSDVYRRLAQATSPEDAHEVYFNLLKTRTNPSVSFYMEAFDYFKNNDPRFAHRVVTSIIAKAPDNKQALRTAGYALEELALFDHAVSLYEHIKKIAPSDAQSHLDLAQAYENNDAYKKAFEEYKKILANNLEGIDFKALQETAENELRRLAKLYRSRVSYQDLPVALLDVGFKKDRRLVFEWSDPAAQFELQFVSPDQKFFTWDHTMYKNAEEVSTNLKTGNMVKEFELDALSEGEWIINLSYLNDNGNSKTAPYLKYTLYTDYATAEERQETQIIALERITQKNTIDNIIINQSN